MVLGHEITGEVVEVGTDVEYIKKGDLVPSSLFLLLSVHAEHPRSTVLRLVLSTAPPLQELTGACAHSARCRSTSLAGDARRASAATRVSASTSTPHARAPPTGASPLAPHLGEQLGAPLGYDGSVAALPPQVCGHGWLGGWPGGVRDGSVR